MHRRLGRSPLASNPLTAALAESQAKTKAPRTTFSLGVEEAERARDAAYHLRLPVVEVVETAIREYVAKLEEEQGKPFPPRPQRRRRRG